MSTTTIRLWVSNQSDVNLDTDCTANYIQASGWQPTDGVTYDASAQMMTGEPASVHAMFEQLAKAVALAGHGVDTPSVPVLAWSADGREWRNASGDVV